MITPDDLEESATIDQAIAEEAVQTAVTTDLDVAIEALLFVSRAPLSISALSEVAGGSPAEVRVALIRLQEHYGEDRSGIVLNEVAGGYQLRSAESQKARVRQLLGIKPQRLTRAAMETLALVAYRQPVTRPEIEDVRGVDCGAVLKALLERGMLRILGKKEEPGRPLLYGTTREFLALFGLSALSALPTLREFRELSEENRSLVERETTGEPLPPSLTELADDSLSERFQDLETEEHRALADLEAAMAEAEARSKLVAPPEDREAAGDESPSETAGTASASEQTSSPSSE